MLLLQDTLIVRPAIAALAGLLMLAAANAAVAGDLTPDAAYALVVRAPLARRDYEEYARRFPEDDRAKEAKAAIKRLAGS